MRCPLCRDSLSSIPRRYRKRRLELEGLLTDPCQFDFLLCLHRQHPSVIKRTSIAISSSMSSLISIQERKQLVLELSDPSPVLSLDLMLKVLSPQKQMSFPLLDLLGVSELSDGSKSKPNKGHRLLYRVSQGQRCSSDDSDYLPKGRILGLDEGLISFRSRIFRRFYAHHSRVASPGISKLRFRL